MHGTGRSFVQYRDAFAPFARWNDCLVLAPLFPVGVRGDGNRHGFKYMEEGGIRYDAVLLAMVAEVEERYGLAFPRFALFGYSGGAHFAHRFLYLHPDRLWAVSIGAPGSVTLPDASRDWWVGIRDLQARFGVPFDPDAVARVPVQVVVGEADLETWEITHREGGAHWMPGANDAGRTRPERAATLARALEALGCRVRLNIVPNMAHDGARSIETVQSFLADTLAGLRGRNEGENRHEEDAARRRRRLDDARRAGRGADGPGGVERRHPLDQPGRQPRRQHGRGRPAHDRGPRRLPRERQRGAAARARASTSRSDGKTYTFRLREGVRFHNGAPLTSAEVLWSWKRYLDPKTDWRCLPDVDGRNGLKIEAVEAPDARTVTMRIDKPSALFLDTLARTDCGMAGILHPDSVGPDGAWKQPVGTGPYMMGPWQRGQHVTLNRFDGYVSPGDTPDGYVGRKRPLAASARFVVIPDAAAGPRGGAVRRHRRRRAAGIRHRRDEEEPGGERGDRVRREQARLPAPDPRPADRQRPPAPGDRARPRHPGHRRLDLQRARHAEQLGGVHRVELLRRRAAHRLRARPRAREAASRSRRTTRARSSRSCATAAPPCRATRRR